MLTKTDILTHFKEQRLELNTWYYKPLYGIIQFIEKNDGIYVEYILSDREPTRIRFNSKHWMNMKPVTDKDIVGELIFLLENESEIKYNEMSIMIREVGEYITIFKEGESVYLYKDEIKVLKEVLKDINV